MKMINLLKLFAVFTLSGLVIIGCNEEQSETCIPANGSLIELTTNIAGKTFDVGNTVKLSWKVDSDRITNGQVVIDISIDNGVNWSAIPEAGIDISSESQYACMEYTWVIGNEGEFVDYADVNNNCLLRIHEYSNNSNGVVFTNQKFTIRNNQQQ